MRGLNSASRPGVGRSVLVSALLILESCASGPGVGRDPNLITREEIGDPSNQTAATIVQRMRPRWLRARSQGSIANPTPTYAMVMLDELLLGDIAALDRIAATQIAQIEFMSALDATTRYGTGYAGGLIIVRTLARELSR